MDEDGEGCEGGDGKWNMTVKSNRVRDGEGGGDREWVNVTVAVVEYLQWSENAHSK